MQRFRFIENPDAGVDNGDIVIASGSHGCLIFFATTSSNGLGFLEINIIFSHLKE